MLARTAVRALANSRQFSSSAARQTKVAVLGAGGGIGQPLSLLLKNDPLVTSLSLYDIRGAPGVAADVSHIDTPSEVSESTCRFSRSNVRQLCRYMVTPRTSLMRRWKVSRSLLFLQVFPARFVLIPALFYNID